MENDVFEDIMQSLRERMEKAIAALHHSLNGLRTGRASTALIEPIKVEAYHDLMPISQLATLNILDSRTISVQVWDKAVVKSVEKAILTSGLGLNPSTEGQLIRIPIPQLNEERRKELCKKASEYAENGKIAIRNIRREGVDKIKKMEKNKEISLDVCNRKIDIIHELLKEFTKRIEESVDNKVSEIMLI